MRHNTLETSSSEEEDGTWYLVTVDVQKDEDQRKFLV